MSPRWSTAWWAAASSSARPIRVTVAASRSCSHPTASRSCARAEAAVDERLGMVAEYLEDPSSAAAAIEALQQWNHALDAYREEKARRSDCDVNQRCVDERVPKRLEATPQEPIVRVRRRRHVTVRSDRRHAALPAAAPQHRPRPQQVVAEARAADRLRAQDDLPRVAHHLVHRALLPGRDPGRRRRRDRQGTQAERHAAQPLPGDPRRSSPFCAACRSTSRGGSCSTPPTRSSTTSGTSSTST